jgi:pyruvate dehydrogenase E2 component (dihydrolipoamide acetyltransferase)
MLGLTMEEGTVAEWLKHEGEQVAKDEPLLMVEMDKGTLEVPSPVAGVLRRIVVQPGQTVPVKAVIAEIGDPNEAPSAAALAAPSAVAAPAPASAGPNGAKVAGGPGDLPLVEATPSELAAASARDARVAASQQSAAPGASVSGRRLFASPRARMRARAMGIEVSAVRGTGPMGRIVESDVLGFSGDTARVLATPLARRLAEEHGVDINAVQGTGPGGRITQDDVLRVAAAPATAAVAAELSAPAPAGPGQVQPLSRVRRITAERMAASSQVVARVTLFLDADFTEAARFRQQLVPEFARLGVPKLPWDALIARAAALALTEHRAVMAQWVAGQGLRASDAVNVGVAVALDPEGLVVPVLRDADRRSLRELSADLLGLVEKARSRRLTPAEMQDGTFTITNLGGYRVDGFTPIVNPPEAAILGVGRIAEKAVVVDGNVVARTMCTLSLSFDHRVVDGAPAAAFLARLAELLERPYALLGI